MPLDAGICHLFSTYVNSTAGAKNWQSTMIYQAGAVGNLVFGCLNCKRSARPVERCERRSPWAIFFVVALTVRLSTKGSEEKGATAKGATVKGGTKNSSVQG